MKAEITHHVGKGSQQQLLPGRGALNKISGGDPDKRTINNYAKAAPDITENGPSIVGPK